MVKHKIKELREERSMTQSQLAEKLGLNYRTISHYENGVSQPDIQTIENLCKIFEVTAGYLLGIEDEFGANI